MRGNEKRGRRNELHGRYRLTKTSSRAMQAIKVLGVTVMLMSETLLLTVSSEFIKTTEAGRQGVQRVAWGRFCVLSSSSSVPFSPVQSRKGGW